MNVSYHFTTEKAGMQGLNREEIDRIIKENTRDSVITKRKEEELEKVKQQVEALKHKLDQLNKNEILYNQNKMLADAKLKEIKNSRIFTKCWLHLDMDMFYAAVEIRDNPSIANLPVAVGDERMVSTSNYVARRYGVRSAMPGFLAKKLCPSLIFVRPNFTKYEEDSRKIMNILKSYDSSIEVAGLDEAYLDITDYCINNYISNEVELTDLIKEIKNKIKNETKITASIGIACNKMLAKICSDINKPDGLFILNNDAEVIENFMFKLKVRKIPSVGEKTEQKLNLLNIYTCADAIKRYVELFHLFSENVFDFIIGACYGKGSYFHEEPRDTRGTISCSDTFRMTNDANFIMSIFNSLAKKLFLDMNDQNLRGKTLTVEIKDRNDKNVSKCLTLKKRFESESEIRDNGLTLLKELWANGQIRMVRLKLSNIIEINPEIDKKKENGVLKKMLNNMRSSVGKENIKEEVKENVIKLNIINEHQRNTISQSTPSKNKTIDSMLTRIKIDSTKKIPSPEKKPQKRKPSNSNKKPNKRGKKINNKTLDNFIFKK
jgi:nucleotidyltransferase/DNA polymerase involved in DNA repair